MEGSLTFCSYVDYQGKVGIVSFKNSETVSCMSNICLYCLVLIFGSFHVKFFFFPLIYGEAKRISIYLLEILLVYHFGEDSIF